MYLIIHSDIGKYRIHFKTLTHCLLGQNVMYQPNLVTAARRHQQHLMSNAQRVIWEVGVEHTDHAIFTGETLNNTKNN